MTEHFLPVTPEQINRQVNTLSYRYLLRLIHEQIGSLVSLVRRLSAPGLVPVALRLWSLV